MFLKHLHHVGECFLTKWRGLGTSQYYIKQHRPLNQQRNWQKLNMGGNFQMIISPWMLSDLKGSKFQQLWRILTNWKNQMKKWSVIVTVIKPIMKAIKFLWLLKVYSGKMFKNSLFFVWKIQKNVESLWNFSKLYLL